MKKSALIALVIVAVAAFIVSPFGTAVSQEVQTVFVSNFPKTWKVTGSVAIDGPVSHGRFVPMRVKVRCWSSSRSCPSAASATSSRVVFEPMSMQA